MPSRSQQTAGKETQDGTRIPIIKPRNILDVAALLAVAAALFLLTKGATRIQPRTVPAAPTPTASVNEVRAQTVAFRSLA